MKSVKLRSPASCCSAPASASWRSALAVVARASDLGSTSQFRLRVELAENFRLGPQLGAHARRLLERQRRQRALCLSQQRQPGRRLL